MNSFFGEVRIRALQPGPRLLPLEVLGLQETANLAALDGDAVLGQLRLYAIQRPVAGWRYLPLRRLGRHATRLRDHPVGLVRAIGGWAPGAWRILQTLQTFSGEALEPLPHRLLTHAHVPSDRRHRLALRSELDDTCSTRQAHRCARRAGEPLTLCLFLVR